MCSLIIITILDVFLVHEYFPSMLQFNTMTDDEQKNDYDVRTNNAGDSKYDVAAGLTSSDNEARYQRRSSAELRQLINNKRFLLLFIII